MCFLYVFLGRYARKFEQNSSVHTYKRVLEIPSLKMQVFGMVRCVWLKQKLTFARCNIPSKCLELETEQSDLTSQETRIISDFTNAPHMTAVIHACVKFHKTSSSGSRIFIAVKIKVKGLIRAVTSMSFELT